MEVKTSSPKETLDLAAKLAASVKAGDLIALYGELGSGKTVFAKGLARGLNVRKRIVSPTFIFQKSYKAKVKGKAVNLHHVDLYRFQDTANFNNLGLEEIFLNDSIIILEWANVIKKLPKKRIDVIFKKVNETTRKIIIKRS